MAFSNVNAESLLLSCFIRHPTTFFQVSEYLTEEDFTNTACRYTYQCIRSLYMDKGLNKISKAHIVSEANSLGIENYMSAIKNGEILDILISNYVDEKESKDLFLTVKKETLRRGYDTSLNEAIVFNRNSTEPLHQHIGNIEKLVLSQSFILDQEKHGIQNLGSHAEEVINNLAEDAGNLGIDIGYPIWQEKIGHIRNASVTFIAATSKSYKSQFGLRAALTTAYKFNLPVLIADSELSKENQIVRLVGMFAKVPYGIIENGYWKLSAAELKSEGVSDNDINYILEYGKRLKDPKLWEKIRKLPIDHLSIQGMGAGGAIPHIRRWMMTKVKPDPNAKVPQCLIIYDYIKLASIDELRGGMLQEYQVHGLNLAALHDFALEYNVPIIAFGQTNRELEDSYRAIAGSERIVWNVDSITLLVRKTAQKAALDPNGGHYMKVIGARNGHATHAGHINFQIYGDRGEFLELEYSSIDMTYKPRKKRQRDDDDDDEDI